MSHTPLPWHNPGMGEIHAENHDLVAHICFPQGDPDCDQCGTEDDAEFIVTACNAHYGLVEALKAIQDEAYMSACHHVADMAAKALEATK